MAHYATQEELEATYDEKLLVRVADYDGDEMADPDVVERGLIAADDIINAYLSIRYPVPVTPVTGILKTLAIDIAVYKMAMSPNARTDEMRVRYEDALIMLQRIADNKIGIGNTGGEDGEEGTDDDDDEPTGRLGGTWNAWRA